MFLAIQNPRDCEIKWGKNILQLLTSTGSSHGDMVQMKTTPQLPKIINTAYYLTLINFELAFFFLILFCQLSIFETFGQDNIQIYNFQFSQKKKRVNNRLRTFICFIQNPLGFPKVHDLKSKVLMQ